MNKTAVILMIVFFCSLNLFAETDKFSPINFHISQLVERNDVEHALIYYLNHFYVMKEGDEVPGLVKLLKIGDTDVLVRDLKTGEDVRVDMFIEWVKEDELGVHQYLFNTITMHKKDTVRNLFHYILSNIQSYSGAAYGIPFYIAPAGYDREVTIAEDAVTILDLLYTIADRAKLELRLQKGRLVLYDKYSGLASLGG